VSERGRDDAMVEFMGDIVAGVFAVAGVVAVVSLLAGWLLRSRPLLMLGGSLGASVALTWILGLLGLPVGILFGFLGAGFLFRPRSRDPRPPNNVSSTQYSEQ
jgi:hypothetical protein